MQKPLTVKFIDALKAGEKRQTFADTMSSNLVLIVQTTGVKTWLWRGRFGGVLKQYTLGHYPTHELVAARAWANEITEGRDIGVNIIEQRQAEKLAAEKNVEAVAVLESRNGDWLFDLYMEHEGSKRKSADEKRRAYKKDIKATIGHLPVHDITRSVLVGILRDKATAAPVMSNRLHSYITRMFKWAVENPELTDMEINPAANLVKLNSEASRERFFDDYEIGLFFKALATSTSAFTEPLRLILYTAVRRTEAFAMPWSEVNWDRGCWIIDKTRTKNGAELVLPLAQEMIDMLRARHVITGTSKLVWPGVATEDDDTDEKPLSSFTTSLGLIRDTMVKEAAKDGKTVERWTSHDIRRTVATGMNSLHDETDQPLITEDIVERILNHKLLGVKGVYNRYGYFKQKKAALRTWADHLAIIRDQALPRESQAA